MINKDVFKEEMQKLELSFNRSLPASARQLWFDDLSNEGLIDEDLRKGIKTLRLNSRVFPSLSEVNQACQKNKNYRLFKDAEKKKKIEKKEMLSLMSDKSASPIAKDTINMLIAINEGKVSQENGLKILKEKYPEHDWQELNSSGKKCGSILKN